jgi:hypothetical protein
MVLAIAAFNGTHMLKPSPHTHDEITNIPINDSSSQAIR